MQIVLTVLILIRLRVQQHSLSVITQYRKKKRQMTNSKLANINDAECSDELICMNVKGNYECINLVQFIVNFVYFTGDVIAL